MPQIIPAGHASLGIELALDLDPEPIYVTFGVSAASPGPEGGDWLGPVGLVEIGTAFRNRFTTYVSNKYAVTGVRADFGHIPEAVTTEVPLSLRFGSAGSPLPQNCAIILRKTSQLGGRRNTGRMFVPGILEGDVTENGTVTSATISQWQAAADGFLADVNNATGVGNMVILHSADFTPPPPGFPAPTPVVGLKVLPAIGTQRRRLRR
jgi:hypothetical protein